MLSELTAVGCSPGQATSPMTTERHLMNRGCWLRMPNFLLSLQTAGLNDLVCCSPDGHPLLAVSALCTACFFQELQMEKSERAFIWATEKQWETWRKKTGAMQSLIGAIFTLTAQIKTYMTTTHVPSELQDFSPEFLLRGNEAQWLHDWEMPR